jgi:NRPS condensation-like uncharacterized protein
MPVPTTQRIPAEPQDAFNDFARVVGDQQLAFVLRFPGRLDEDRLAEAVATLIESQPVLGCRFVAEAAQAWHEPVASAPLKAVELVRCLGDPWPRALEAASQPLDPAGPHLSLTLVRCLDADALAVRIDHTAADGQGAKACLAALARAYATAARDGDSGAAALDATSSISADAGQTAGAPAPSAALPDRSWRRLRQAAGPRRITSAVLRRRDPRPTWGLPALGGTPGSRVHEVATVSAEEFSAAREWGRERGFTVNDLVLAAFYRAMFGVLDAPAGVPMVVRVSFDQRRYLAPDDPMPPASNLSSVEAVELDRILGEAFEGAADRVHERMEAVKSASPGLGSAALLETMYRARGFSRLHAEQTEAMRRGQEAGRSYPFVSNFGVLDAEPLAFDGAEPVRAVMLPVAGHPPFVMLGASTYRGELSLAIGYADGEIDPSIPRGILVRMVADLTRVAAE